MVPTKGSSITWFKRYTRRKAISGMASPIVKANCEICSDHKAIYCCPGCSVRTCSLVCVKQHKAFFDCSGKRKVAQFINVAEFTDKNLVDDITFLEATARKFRCGEDKTRVAITVNTQNQRTDVPTVEVLPSSVRCSTMVLSKLIKAARMRDVQLKLAPFLTIRRKTNSTYCNARNVHKVNKQTKVFWHIRWKLHACEENLEERSVNENAVLADLVTRFTLPQTKSLTKIDANDFESKLAESNVFTSAVKSMLTATQESDVCIGLVAEHLNKKNVIYSLDKKLTLRDNFRGKTIVEHPILVVVPKSNIATYQIVE